MADDAAPAKNIADCQTFEDYLDLFVTEQDLFYLEDADNARQIVELGYKPNAKDFMLREEFEMEKRAQLEGPQTRTKSAEEVLSDGLSLVDSPFLYALQKREELVRNGKLSTIIFLRTTVNGHEVSGYIDFFARLKNDNFLDYFKKKRTLVPRRTDLSYYNWKTHTLYYNNSATFQVLADSEAGLMFKHRRDRKTINVDPRAPTPGDNSSRTVLVDDMYTQITLYDHVTRRKN